MAGDLVTGLVPGLAVSAVRHCHIIPGPDSEDSEDSQSHYSDGQTMRDGPGPSLGTRQMRPHQ